MNTRRLMELVEEHSENTYALATAVAEMQKEADAVIAEQIGASDAAAAIRSN